MRLWQHLSLICAAFVLAFSLAGNAMAAPANETAAGTHGTTAEHAGSEAGEHKKGGMPQLDPTRFPSQIFWMVLSFAALYLLMRNVAMPAVERTLEARAAQIEGDIAAAKAMNEQAKKLSAEYEAGLNKARSEAQDIYRIATDETSKRASALLADQQNTLNARLKQAEDRLSQLKADAIAGIEQEAVGVVGDLVKRLADMNVDTPAIQAAVKQVKGA